ncbi:MAG: hypothetical protein M3Q07_17735 [Pseudobdellovibrionaceae bacterium]|nr:hypothetical protein [Pseudobdellovibrionaceae bacterium]
MGYPAQTLVLQDVAADALNKVPNFLKSLDLKRIAKYAALAGAGILAFKSFKMLVYGKVAAAAYDKTKELIRS